MTEFEIRDQIVDYLRHNKVFCWLDRQPVRKPGKGTSSKSKGVPDILGILSDGKFLGIEVKKPGGKLSDEQREFLYKASQRGAVSIVAYDVQDVIDYFKARGTF